LSKSCLIHNHTNNNTQATRSLFSIPKQQKQNNNDHHQTMINTQEIEVKITLLSKADYDKFEQHMGEPKAIIEQENIFFDGSKQEITKPRSMIRLRFFKDAQGNEKCVLTHKGKANISQGISSVEEQEESVDANDARAAVKDPSLMKQWKGELMDMIRDTYKIEEYVCLGGFKNLRKKYDWEGYVLEFDQVTYPFGMNYEIEVETADAAILKPKLTQLLDSLNIQYQDSKRSKFANFFSGSIAL